MTLPVPAVRPLRLKPGDRLHIEVEDGCWRPGRRPGIAVPDAIIAATGVVAGCDIRIANDQQYRRMEEAPQGVGVAGPGVATSALP